MLIMSNDQFPTRGPEQPRAEPEILPPERDGSTGRGPEGVWIGGEGVHRIFIARPGLPTIILVLLIVGLVAALVLVVLAGIVLLWIPIVVGGILLALLSGTVRHRWHQLRAWLTRS
jgi:hypothetical protein